MLKIMDFIVDASFTAGAIASGIVRAGYGASASKMDRSINKALEGLDDIQAARLDRRRRYQRYITMINYLKRGGLIEEKRIGEELKLYLTAKGRAKRTAIRKEQQLRIPTVGYESSPGKKVVIVAYDIPEKMYRYRDWLRTVLARLGMKKLQRSVWIGKVVIPEQLINDLFKYKIEEYVEIIEVGAAGTMREII